MLIKLLSIFFILTILNTSCGTEDKVVKEKQTKDTSTTQTKEPETRPAEKKSNNKLRLRINGRPVYTAKNIQIPQEALIRDEVLYETAILENKDTQPDFVELIERYKRNQLIGRLKRDIIQNFNATHKITDEGLKKYYEENINDYIYLDLIELKIPSEEIANDIHNKLSTDSNITTEQIVDIYKNENVEIVLIDLSNTRAFNNKFSKLEVGQFTKPEKVVTKYSIYMIEAVNKNELGKVKHIVLSNYKSSLKKKALDDYVADSIKNNNIKIEEINE